MKAKYLQTQQRIYTEHLEVEKPSPIRFASNRKPPISKSLQLKSLQTNFAISLKNHYAFVLIHLRKTAKMKNSLNVLIPQVGIFYNHQLYDIIFNDNNKIQGIRQKQPIRLKEMYSFFKNKWRQKSLRKQQPSFACFQKQEYLMMSDTDLFITCRKFKNDSFFSKLSYIRNKINSVDNPICIEYEAIRDSQFAGKAMQSLMNSGQYEGDLVNEFGETKYLRYCNSKICLFLNYQHNIRVQRAKFYYSKTINNQYAFIDVTELQYTNLTNAIKQRQKRLKVKQQQRNQCLIMTPQKQQRYKFHQNSPNVQILQEEMNNSWIAIAQKLRIKTNQQRVKEQQRNRQAFKILYPQIRSNFDVLLTSTNFRKLKKDILNLEPKKPLYRHTNRIKMESNRCLTEETERKDKTY